MANPTEAAAELWLALRVRNDSAGCKQFRPALFRCLQPARFGQTRLPFRQRHLFQPPLTAHDRRLHAWPTATVLRHEPASRSIDWKADDCRAASCVHRGEPTLSANAEY